MKFRIFFGTIVASILDRLFDRKWVPKMDSANYPVATFLAANIDQGAQADFWKLFGHHLANFWLPSAPFWLPLAPLWLPFCFFWLPFAPFGSLLASFWLLLALFGSLLVPFCNLSATMPLSSCSCRCIFHFHDLSNVIGKAVRRRFQSFFLFLFDVCKIFPVSSVVLRCV